MSTVTQVRIVVAAAGIAICLAYLAGGARGIGAGDRDYVFSPAVEPQAQLDAAAADVPLGAPPTLSALAARASLAVALGRRSAVRDFAAVSAALAAVAFGAALYAAGLPPFAVAIAAIGLALGNTFWWRGITYTADALFPALAMLATWAALRWQATPRRPIAVLATVAAAIAIVDYAVPLIGHASGAPSPQGFIPSLVREFTPLGAFLAVVGLAVILRAPRSRVPGVIVAVAILGWHALSRSAIEPITVPVVLAGWWAIAVAIGWMHRLDWQRARPWILGAVAVVLSATPILTRGRLAALGGDEPTRQRVRIANEFPIADAPAETMVVAESRRADAAILLASRLAQRPLTIVPQSPDHVAEALRTGRPVVAFDNARANLEQQGFLFERSYAGTVAVATLAGRVPCAPLREDVWQDVSLILANESVIIHGAASAAPGGVVLRMPAPIAVAAIEPRSIPYEIGETTGDAEGTPLASIRVPATGRRSPVTLTLSSAPAHAMARADGALAASICPGVQRAGVTLGAAATATASVRMSDSAPFGPGWHPVEADPDLFRWTSLPDASLRITSVRPGRVHVTITATPASRPAQQPTIGLTVNSCRLEIRPMHAGQGDYEWTVEERCWLPGVNQLWIHTSPLIAPASLFATHDTRLLGSRIGAIRFARR